MKVLSLYSQSTNQPLTNRSDLNFGYKPHLSTEKNSSILATMGKTKELTKDMTGL